MNYIVKRILAALLAGAMLMPSAAFAAGDGNAVVGARSVRADSDGQDAPTSDPFNGSIQSPYPAPGFLVNLESGSANRLSADSPNAFYTIRALEGHVLNRIVITVDKKTPLELTPKNMSTGNSYISVSIDQWPEVKFPEENSVETARLALSMVEGATSSHSITVQLMAGSTKQKHRVTCESAGRSGTVTTEKETYYEGDIVTVVATAYEQYRLRMLRITHTDKSGKVQEQDFEGAGGQIGEWTVTWGDTEATIIAHNGIESSIQVEGVFERIPEVYSATTETQTGLTSDYAVQREVTEGQSMNFGVTARSGYTVSNIQIRYGKYYYSWAEGQPHILFDHQNVKVNSEGNKVSFTLPEIYGDITVTFFSGFDRNNIPVTLEDANRVTIDANVGSTVKNGEDAEIYIGTTSERYTIDEISLTVGDYTGTAKPDAEYIRVGSRRYELESMGAGEYTLYVENINEPVVVTAKAKTSSSVTRPTLTVRAGSHLSITKSVSSNRIEAGDDVEFYITPDSKYQIDEITVTIGGVSRTVGGNRTSVRIDGVDYRMSRDRNGVVTLFLTDIEENVTVAATAYYNTSPLPATNDVVLNKSSRAAFLNGDPNGYFRPEDSMTRGEAVVMLYRLCDANAALPTSSVYHDVPLNAWYAIEINAFAAADIIDRSSYFYPERSITRGELAEMLYRLDGSPAISSASTRFTDTSANAVRYAATQGWVNGYGDGTFRPYNYSTRAEVAAMITRVLGRTSGGNVVSYRDVPTNHWAYRYIQLASSYV